MKMHLFEILIGLLLMIIISYATMIVNGCTTSETIAKKTDSSYGFFISDDEADRNVEQSETTVSSVCIATPFSNNGFTFNEEQIEEIRKELSIPDYKIEIAEVDQGDAYLWEGTGLWMVPVTFYIDDECIARADVNIEDWSMMRSVIARRTKNLKRMYILKSIV